MAKMKVKNLLKMVNSSEISITVKNDISSPRKYKTYYINYLSEEHGVSYDGDTCMKCCCITYLPDHVLDRTVTFVSAFENRVDISCY